MTWLPAIRFVLEMMALPAGVAIVFWVLLAEWNSIFPDSIKRAIAVSAGLLFLLPTLALPEFSDNELANAHARVLGGGAAALAAVLGRVAINYSRGRDICGHALLVLGSLNLVFAVIELVARIPH